MAICKKCGNEFEDGLTACPTCGAAVEVEEEVTEEVKVEETATEEVKAEEATTEEAKAEETKTEKSFLDKLMDTKEESADAKDAENNKAMGIIAYIWILFLVPIFAAKESQFARYHANQGLVLFIIETVVSVILFALGWVPVLGVILSLLGSLVELCCFVLMILGIVNAVNGKCKELPLIGGIKIIK